MEYYLTMKKNEIMPFAATWMDLEVILLGEVSQKEKGRYHLPSLPCGTLKYDAKEPFIKQKQTLKHRQN